MLFIDRLDIAPVHVAKLRVGAGITTLSAPSGAGKTRFFLAIADLIVNAGKIRLDETERERIPAPAWRRLVRYASAEPAWWAPTVRENLPTYGAVRGMAERFGLGKDLVDKPVAELSTGERQRFGLVRALASDPPVLLLDEPTSALDETATLRVEELLRELAQKGRIVFMISHSDEQVRRIADRALEIEDGVIAERS